MKDAIISAAEARTLPGLLRRRIEATPDAVAYCQYVSNTESWEQFTWREVGTLVEQWRRSLAAEGLAPGDRVAIWLKNSVEWVCFEQAALALGLVVVPLYLWDSPANVAGILTHADAKLLLIGSGDQAELLAPHRAERHIPRRILCLSGRPFPDDRSIVAVQDWLADHADVAEIGPDDPEALATIIYTSGTTGRPKGVMLSHRNILANAEAALQVTPSAADDVFLSVLPLAHAFERTVGHYVPMMGGGRITYARSIHHLAEDLVTIRPTILVTVPRLLERIETRIRRRLAKRGWLAQRLFGWTVSVGWQRFLIEQRRRPPSSVITVCWSVLRAVVARRILERVGGRVRLVVSGGAPLAPEVARFFLSLGLPIIQGYGLTEAGPVVSGNSLQDNRPESVGKPLPGVEVRLGAEDELLVRSPGVMLGYWRMADESRLAVDAESWLHTGDVAELRDGRIYLHGRLGESFALSTGHKIAPTIIEAAILRDPLFDQVMVTGEGKPFVAMLAVLDRERWRELAAGLGLEPDDPASLHDVQAHEEVGRLIGVKLQGLPSYMHPRVQILRLDPWTIDQGLMTPTLKLRRAMIAARHEEEIRALYLETSTEPVP